MRHPGGGVHSGHIQSTYYSSEGEDRIIYTFCITIWRPSWIFSFYSGYLLYNTSNILWI